MDPLTRLIDLFTGLARPHHFGNPEHCSECAEHDETLRSHTPDTISLAELGNPGWDPICFVDSIDGFRYYLPALARLCCGKGDEYYLGQFLFHLNDQRVGELAAGERAVIADFLEDLLEQMPDEIDANLDTDSLFRRIEQLRQELAP